MTTRKKSIYNIISGVTSQVILAALGLIIPRLILVRFGSEMNGLINSVLQIYNYIALVEAGVSITAIQALYKPITQNDRTGINGCMSAVSRYYTKSGILYIILMLIFAVAYPLVITTSIDKGIISIIILLSGINGALTYLLYGKYKILLEADGRKYVIINTAIAVNLISNLGRIVLLVSGFSIVAVQLFYSLIMVSQAVIISLYTEKNYPWLDLKTDPDYKSISQRYSALIHQISGLIFNGTDIIVLTVMTNLKVVSVYAMYNMIINLIANTVNQLANGFTYRLGQLFHSDRQKFLKYHNIFEILNFYAVFAGFTMVYILILPFLSLYTQGVTDINYIDDKLPLLFVLVPLLSNGRVAAGNVINYAEHFEKTRWRSVLESVINITVTIAAVSRFGIYGALAGTIAALLYRTNDIIWYADKKILGISPWITYKRWIVNFIIFIIFITIHKSFDTALDNYVDWIINAIIWALPVLLVYGIAAFIFMAEVKNKYDS